MSQRRYEFTDFEWSIIKPRVNDRRVSKHLLAGAIGSPWADIPGRYGPPTTCPNRFQRWAKIGVWDRVFAAVS